MISHPGTGFFVGDPDAHPFSGAPHPSPAEIRAVAASLILSASGWRKVFAADGDEDSLLGAISRPDKALAALMAAVFADYMIGKGGPGCRVALGLDSRPTGPEIADVMARVFISRGLKVSYLFIVCAPEIMAYAREGAMVPAQEGERPAGFCYISASHNPPGHNGLKFGLRDGGVLSKEESEVLIQELRRRLESDKELEAAIDAAASAPAKEVALAFSSCAHWKRLAYSAYMLFSREVVSGSSVLEEQEDMFERLSRSLSNRPLGVLAEMNGSARGLSIDADFLSSAGLRIRLLNQVPREFAHRIVPEGASLDLCRESLEKLHAEDPGFILGYVPDCDGDRGNLVYYDDTDSRARILEAQEVFALSVLSELAILDWSKAAKTDKGPAPAVCMNDPTSMRIEEIAAVFGARCLRAEVGEANVVNLAREARAQGLLVRVLGEGSNGGSIIHPSAVRDPIDTVMAVIKLLALRDEGERECPFKRWMRLSGQAANYRPDFSLHDIIASLPAYATTSAFEPRAALKIKTRDQGALKRAFEGIFKAEWKERAVELERRFGIQGWKAIGYRGTVEDRDLKAFGDSASGGLKIEFLDKRQATRAFIWMRGSGTEAVFRIMADVRGGLAEDEAYLLAWQTDMVKKADEACQG